MTVQELINELEKIEEKSSYVYYQGVYEDIPVEEVVRESCDISCEIKVVLS